MVDFSKYKRLGKQPGEAAMGYDYKAAREASNEKARRHSDDLIEKHFAPNAGTEVELVGEIDFVRVVNDRTGWGFARIYTKVSEGHRAMHVPIVGLVNELYDTAEVELLGKWVKHHKFGWQVDMTYVVVALPNTMGGVAAWLEERFPDIGPKRALDIVRAFPPPSLWDVLESEPQKLTTIDGIGEVIAEGCAQAYQLYKYEREAFVELASLGLKADQIRAAIKLWRDKAVEVLTANPYELRRLPMVGWKQADTLARRAGVGLEDPRRIVEGLRYALELGENEGHTCRGQKRIIATACKADVLGLGMTVVAKQFQRALDDGAVVEDGGAFYRPETLKAERLIADRIATLIECSPPLPDNEGADGGVKLEIDKAPPSPDGAVRPVLDETQRYAVDFLCTEGFGVLTGGPGTGKTTTFRSALDEIALRAKKVNRRSPYIALAAPTGKAARRMSEATGRQAMTLHRLLGWAPEQGGWEHHPGNPLDIDVLFVDESSMLDTQLAAGLLGAVDPRRTRVWLVGDVNQLPSVGPGRVLGDVIDSEVTPLVRLATVHRQAQESWVYRNAPRILQGEIPDLSRTSDFEFVEFDDEEMLSQTLIGVFETELNAVAKKYEVGSESAFDMVQILSPQKKGLLGVEALNLAIQRAWQGANPQGGWEVHDDLSLYESDKVMQTRNNYELEVMNGETGMVIGTSKGKLIVNVEGEERVYDKSSARDLLLGYAVTIHKSQGSEWPTVVVVCHSSHTRMLSRQLLYTAITRAKGRLVLVGNRLGLEKAVGNARIDERQTGLVKRLQDAVPKIPEGMPGPTEDFDFEEA